MPTLLWSLLLVWNAAQLAAPDTSEPRVTTASGVLEGSRTGSSSNETIFLGIPFAAPPVGDLRWRPPQPVAHWTGIRPAKNFAASCPQLPSSWWPEMAGRERLNVSEDCLYLNVWTTQFNRTKKIPVLVWIHGGGNVEGSSQVPRLGPPLARQGVVVVSVEYRLGVLGFLAHPALSAESPDHSSGNYGLLDQIAALAWIQTNIGAFGGDPKKVTILGESSGAEDVCHLLVSPLAKDLFQSAIMESGVCMDSLYSALHQKQEYYRNHGPGERLGVRMSEAFGIADTPQAAAKLRALPVDRLLQWAHDADDADFGVVIDGRSVPRQPVVSFALGRQAHVPVLVGSNADETTVFGKSSPLAVENSRPKTIAQYRAWLKNEFGEFAEEVWQAYPARADDSVPHVFVRMQTDYDFGFGADRLARAMSAQGKPAYLYYFTYSGRDKFASLGAFHSEELMFLGDDYWKSWVSDANDRRLAGIMTDYWTQFVKTGDPNQSNLPRWPQYVTEGDLCLELGKVVEARPTPNRAGYSVFERILKARLAEITSGDESTVSSQPETVIRQP
jgi:para-nitrobenzyl esterase